MSTPSPRSFWSSSRAKRRVLVALCALALSSFAGACSDEKSSRQDPDAGADAGPPPVEGKSSLRPALERPPTNGLPADLRPPR